MRILLVSTSVVKLGGKGYGGIEKLVTDFAKGFVQAGEDVTVAAPVGSIVPKGVVLMETVSLPEQQDEDWLTEGLIHQDEFDIIHDFSHRHVLRDSEKAIHMMWDNITIHYPFKAKRNIITLSEWQKERFQRMYGQNSLVMPMCVDTDVYHPLETPRNDRFLFLGKISADKGVHLAIKYCKELGVPLDVVGGLIDSELNSGYLKEIRELCDGEKIRLHFNVDEVTKIGFLQSNKALIYPVQMVEAHWLTGVEEERERDCLPRLRRPSYHSRDREPHGGACEMSVTTKKEVLAAREEAMKQQTGDQVFEDLLRYDVATNKMVCRKHTAHVHSRRMLKVVPPRDRYGANCWWCVYDQPFKPMSREDWLPR